MAIKIYSDKTKKFYDSMDAANEAEAQAQEQEELARIEKERKEQELKEQKEKAAAERKALATEVDGARKELVKAQKAYKEKLEEFCKKYGTYHYTIENAEDVPTLFDFFGNLFHL